MTSMLNVLGEDGQVSPQSTKSASAFGSAIFTWPRSSTASPSVSSMSFPIAKRSVFDHPLKGGVSPSG
jgi:hypothetical protein